MIKILDYYYLVLLRHYDLYTDAWSYRASGIMSLTLTVNVFSFITLFNAHILDNIYFWISIVIFCIFLFIIIDMIYNKKRREMLREKYEDESVQSRQWGVVKVILYEVLSVVFLIFACSMINPKFVASL